MNMKKGVVVVVLNWINISSLAIIVLLLFTNVSQAFVYDRTGPGIQACNSSTLPFLVSRVSNFTLRNCVYVNCPQIAVVNSNVTIQNVTFINDGVTSMPALSSDGGGIFYISQTSDAVWPASVLLQNVTFQKSYSAGDGGSMLLTGSGLSALLQNVTFYQVKGGGDSSAISLKANASLTLDGCSIIEATSPAIYANAGMSLSLTNCLFTGNMKTGGVGGGVGNMGNTVISIDRCTFRDFNIPGITIPVFQSQANYFPVSVTNSLFANINAPDASSSAAIYFQEVSQFTLVNCSFINVTSSSGAIEHFNILVQGTFVMSSCFFSGNRGSSSSDVMVTGPVTVTVSNCLFTTGYSSTYGSLYLSGVNSFDVSRCTFNLISSYRAALCLYYTPGSVRDCNFTGNAATGSAGGIYLGGPATNISINRCSFIANSGSDGAAISGDTNIACNITNCRMIGNNGDSGGCIYFQAGIQVIIQDCSFDLNTANILGGAIYSVGTSVLQVQRCNFTRNLGGQGGAIALLGLVSDSIQISNAIFRSNKATSSGGDIVFTGKVLVTISNCQFESSNSIGGTGGSISILDELDLTLTDSTFKDIQAFSGGLIICFGFSNIQVSRCTFTNISAAESGHLVNATGISITFSDTTFSHIGNVNVYGPVFSTFRSNLVFDKLIFDIPCRLFELGTASSVTVIGQLLLTGQNDQLNSGSLATLADGSSFITAPGSTISGFTGTSLVVMEGRSSFYMTGMSIFNCTLSGAAIVSKTESVLTMINSTFLGSPGGCMNFIATSGASRATIQSCQITQCAFKGCGPVSIGQQSLLDITNTSISNNFYFYANANIPCSLADRNNPLRGFGGAFCVTGRVNLADNIQIVNNTAVFGGAFYVGPDGNLTFGGRNIVVGGNLAFKAGGAFYMATGSRVNLGAPSVRIVNNSVYDGGTHSSLAYFSGDNGGFIRGPVNNSTIVGESFVTELTTARLIKAQQSIPGAFFPSPIWGKTDYVRIINKAALNGGISRLTLNTTLLPPIRIQAYDIFGNIATIGSNEVVSIRLIESSNKSVLVGEAIKAIIDLNNSIVTFTNIEIADRLPGRYQIAAIPVTNLYAPTDLAAVSQDYPLDYVEMEYENCEPNTQKLYPSLHACLDVQTINYPLKVVMSILGGFVVIFVVRCLIRMYSKGGIGHLLDGNRQVFCVSVLVGAIISMFSLITQSLKSDNACTISFTFNNVGFFFTIFSIIGFSCLSYVDMKIKSTGSASETLQSFEKKFLKLLIIPSFTLTIVAFIVVSVLFSPFTSYVDVPNLDANTVLIDKCETFNVKVLTIASFKLFLTLIASVISSIAQRMVKNDPAHPNPFQESQLVSLTSYNITIFGSALELVTSLNVISQAEAWLAIRSISLIFTNLVTVMALVWIKFYLAALGRAGASASASNFELRQNNNNQK